MSKKPTYLTVVYEINDPESFKEENDRIFEKFGDNSEQPWRITAVSRDHEMQRLELIESAVEERDIYLIEDIIAAGDVMAKREELDQEKDESSPGLG